MTLITLCHRDLTRNSHTVVLLQIVTGGNAQFTTTGQWRNVDGVDSFDFIARKVPTLTAGTGPHWDSTRYEHSMCVCVCVCGGSDGTVL